MWTKGLSMTFEVNKIIIKESVFFSQFEMRKLAFFMRGKELYQALFICQSLI